MYTGRSTEKKQKTNKTYPQRKKDAKELERGESRSKRTTLLVECLVEKQKRSEQ